MAAERHDPTRCRGEDDHPALLEMIARHEGEASAADRGTLVEPPAGGVVGLRDAGQRPVGCLALVALEAAAEADLAPDPVAAAAAADAEAARAFASGDAPPCFVSGWQQRRIRPSPIQSLVFILAVQHYLSTSDLAYTLFPCADPDFWAMVLAYADLERLPEADFEIGSRRYGVYGHDWRRKPPAAWLDLLAKREIAAGPQAAPNPRPARSSCSASPISRRLCGMRCATSSGPTCCAATR